MSDERKLLRDMTDDAEKGTYVSVDGSGSVDVGTASYMLNGEGKAELQVIPDAPLDEDLYGFALVALMRDCHFLADPSVKKGQKAIRYTRLVISVALIVMNTLLQVYLIWNVKKYITAATVVNVRGVYDVFESAMYDKTTKTVNGNHRGVEGHFHMDHFDSLSETQKEEACQIPLSQPEFLLVFIFLWSLTCLSDVKKGLGLAYKILVTIPIVDSMSKSIDRVDGEPTARKVVGITWCLRIVLVCLVIIPRIGVGLGMTWLGCRWLIATNAFADLFLNAVALAFVFDLKDTFYNQLLPDRNKRDVQGTYFPPSTTHEEASVGAYLKGLLIAPVTLAWAFFYVYKMQMVLPKYGWDVHETCAGWLVKHFTV